MAWNGSDGVTSSSKATLKRRKNPSAWRGLVAAVVIVAIASAVLFFFSSDVQSFFSGEGDASKVLKAKVTDKTAKKRTDYYAPLGRTAKKTSNVDDALDNVGELDLPVVEQASEPVYINKYTNRYFKTGVEQVMGWVFTCQLGNMPPPLPTLADDDRENLVAILLSHNEIKDSDDEAAADAKETVDFAKQEMMRFIKEGGDPQEFMEYYHAELRKASDYRCLVVDQAEALYEEDPELCQEFIEKVNEKLDEHGIRPISISDFE